MTKENSASILKLESTEDFIAFCEEVEKSEIIQKIISYIKDFETNNSFVSFKNGEIGTEQYIDMLKRNESIIGFFRSFSIAKNRILEDIKRKEQQEQQDVEDTQEGKQEEEVK